MGSQQFCLKWNNHQSNMLTVFDQLLTDESFVDVTIACDGFTLKAHKMVLSACSPYFQKIFVDNPCQHPVVILKDISYEEMKAIIDFMYKGEVNVSQDQLSALLKTAEALKVKGLAEVTSEQVPEKQVSQRSSIAVKRPAGGSVRSLASSRRKRKPSGTTIRSTVQQPLAASAITGGVTSNSSAVEDESVQEDNNESETVNETSVVQEFVSATIGNIKDEVVDDQIETNDVVESEDPETEQMDYSLQEYLTTSMATPSTNTNDTRVSNVNSPTSGVTIGPSSSSGVRPSTSAGKKPKEKKSTLWTVTDLMNAIECVHTGKMNVLKAARTFGIPKSSLYDYITGRSGARLKLYDYNKCKNEAVKDRKVVSHLNETMEMPYLSKRNVQRDVIVGQKNELLRQQIKDMGRTRQTREENKQALDPATKSEFNAVCEELSDAREINDEDIVVVSEETVSATYS